MDDLYDGRLYSVLRQAGFLADPNNISLSWYTDGVPVFSSSHIGMWPLFFIINELPFHLRMKRENIILAGLWFGDKKPAANHFLRQFRESLQQLYEGYNFFLPGENQITVRGVLLYGACDLPAKAQFLNIVQFNGAYGCPNCLNPGETYHLDTGGFTHVYRYQDQIDLRTAMQTIGFGLEAHQRNEAVMGVKGPCTLATFMPDYILGTGIDRMHGGDGGVTKKLLDLWFSSKHQAQPFSLVAVKDIISARLKEIKPPKWVHRIPRSLDDVLHWKASELRM